MLGPRLQGKWPIPGGRGVWLTRETSPRGRRERAYSGSQGERKVQFASGEPNLPTPPGPVQQAENPENLPLGTGPLGILIELGVKLGGRGGRLLLQKPPRETSSSEASPLPNT